MEPTSQGSKNKSCAPKGSFGNVGYHFCKYFPGHGYFDGIIMQIRPNAAHGKDRRCVYSDGDFEDLSLYDLHAIAREAGKSERKPSINHDRLWEAGKEIIKCLNGGHGIEIVDDVIKKYGLITDQGGEDVSAASHSADDEGKINTGVKSRFSTVTINEKPRRCKNSTFYLDTTDTDEEEDTINKKPRRCKNSSSYLDITETDEEDETINKKPRRRKNSSLYLDITETDEEGDTTNKKPRRCKNSTFYMDMTDTDDEEDPPLTSGNEDVREPYLSKQDIEICNQKDNAKRSKSERPNGISRSKDSNKKNGKKKKKPRRCKNSTFYMDMTDTDDEEDPPLTSGNEDVREPYSSKQDIEICNQKDNAKRSKSERPNGISRSKDSNKKNEKKKKLGTTPEAVVDIFASASELVPIDNAAEYNLDVQTNFVMKNLTKKRDRSHDEDWLEKVASLLGASNSTSAYRLKTRKTDVVPKEIIDSATSKTTQVDSQNTIVLKEASNQPRSDATKDNNGLGDTCYLWNKNDKKECRQRADIQVTVQQANMGDCDDDISQASSYDSLINNPLLMLIDVKSGARHGLKVFDVDDEKRIVGEVLMEHPRGWVEAIMNGDVKKKRVRQLVVVPHGYEMGDKVDPQIPLPNTRESIKSRPPQTSTSLKKIPTLPSEEDTVSIDNLFYWCCKCKEINKYTDEKCVRCDCRRNKSCTPSALLDMAEHAVGVSSTYEEMLESIPLVHRSSLPKSVLQNLMPNTQPVNISPFSSRLDSYFYWNCYSCTMANSFKRASCEVCHKKNCSNTTSSILLHIAKEAAQKALSVEEALSAIPFVHKPAIPKAVLEVLVTCIATTSKDNRRCARQRVPGSNYCHLHTDTVMMTENEEAFSKVSPTCEIVSESSSGVNSDHNIGAEVTAPLQEVSNAVSQSILSLISNVSNLLDTKFAPHHVNKLQWAIHSIEDAIISQEHSPFSLGMRIRRFFPTYGFHDGTISRIQRETIGEPNGKSRPVFLYRVQYNDGDSEDLFQHQVNSLRQLYDQCNVKPTAPAREQFLLGTLYETLAGNVKVIKLSRNCSSDGKVSIDVFRPGERWSTVEMNLTQLQLIVVRKLQSSDLDTTIIRENENDSISIAPVPQSVSVIRSEMKTDLAPILEWPSTGRPILTDIEDGTDTELKESASIEQKGRIPVIPGLWICREPLNDSDDSDNNESDESDIDDQCCVRPGVKCSGWDPAGGLPSVLWDPFKVLICERCKSGSDETRILICDKCNRGYHTYCLRPVIVNIPSEQWLCPHCKDGNKQVNFENMVDELTGEPPKVSSFLNFPFSDCSYFCIFHKESLELFSPTASKSKKLAVLGPLSDSKPTRKLGALHVSRTKNRHLWILPIPLSEPNTFCRTLATMVAAMTYCGMEKYSENLVYDSKNGVTELMNNPNLDLEEVGPLNKLNLGIFARYKENLKEGAYPPIRIVNDDNTGFTVQAMAVMPRHTIITEYTGVVTTVENSYDTSSDSLMSLLETGDPKTSLIIDPTREGNIARFLNGINNGTYLGRRKANVKSRRFSYEGTCRVVLFTSKQIEPGDMLHYDYNAGNQGKSVAEWADSGFYDTSNFV